MNRFGAPICATLLLLAAHAIAADPLAPIGIALKQPVAVAEPVTEILYGTTTPNRPANAAMRSSSAARCGIASSTARA